MSVDILIVDDEADIRKLIRGILEDEGYQTREAGSSLQAYQAIKEKLPGVVILDIWLQGSQDDGLEVLKKMKAAQPDLPFIMISGHGTIETAVSAIKDGAYDFIEKPFKSDRLLMMVRRALENAQLKRENARLRKSAHGQADELVGSSSEIQNLQQMIERAAPTNSRILITGEPGVGKEVVARQIHKNSSRAAEVFMVLNCATLQPERLEHELFGAEGGVNGEPEYTGILEQAQGGTILLDEIADMPLGTQNKIVRVLQEQQFHKIGGQKAIELDVRVLATTNKDLKDLIAKGVFREDLFYRLNVVELKVPALRARAEDVPALADIFIRDVVKMQPEQRFEFSSAALGALKAYKWPGNVRQLKNVIEWVHIMHSGSLVEGIIKSEHLPNEIRQNGDAHHQNSQQTSGLQDDYIEMPLREAREAFEREYLLAQVARFDGNVSKTAQFVGMERSALHRKLKSLQIKGEAEAGDDDNDAVPEKMKRA